MGELVFRNLVYLEEEDLTLCWVEGCSERAFAVMGSALDDAMRRLCDVHAAMAGNCVICGKWSPEVHIRSPLCAKDACTRELAAWEPVDQERLRQRLRVAAATS